MAGLFPNSTLDQVRSASDIVEVIGAVLPLKRAGASFVALCPFHKEKSPSFHVNPQRQIFHCFGCHKGGDVFKFVQEYEAIGFVEAVRRLAERASIPLETIHDEGEQKSRFLKESLLQIHEQIAQHWQRVLAADAAGQTARDYLAKRGVTAEAVQLFRLGAAPEAWDDTVNWAKSKGHDLALMEQAGLILHKEGSGHHYDRFRGRLMFPICDEQGRVVGFSGRVLTGDEKTAKYVNSPETPIFTKGKIIYGLDKTKRALLDTKCAIICEGQLDLIACFMAGVKHVAAPQGTALTADHARILKRYVDEVILCFDSDLAGQKATVNVLDPLLAAGLAIRVATLPAPHDPDSLIKEAGAEGFQRVIQQATSFFDYYLNQLCRANNPETDKGRMTIVQNMATAVQKTNNAVLIDTYAQKTAQRLNVALSAMRQEFGKLAGTSKNSRTEPAPEPDVPAAVRPSAQEFWLLKILFHEETDMDWAIAHLDLNWLQHSGVRDIVSRRLDAHARQTWTGVASLLAGLPETDSQSLFSEALSDPRPLPNATQQVHDVILRLRNQSLDRQSAALLRQISQPELPDDERQQLLSRQQALRGLKSQPLQPLNP